MGGVEQVGRGTERARGEARARGVVVPGAGAEVHVREGVAAGGCGLDPRAPSRGRERRKDAVRQRLLPVTVDVGEVVNLLVTLVGTGIAEGGRGVVDRGLVEVGEGGAAPAAAVGDADVVGIVAVVQIVHPVHHVRQLQDVLSSGRIVHPERQSLGSQPRVAVPHRSAGAHRIAKQRLQLEDGPVLGVQPELEGTLLLAPSCFQDHPIAMTQEGPARGVRPIGQQHMGGPFLGSIGGHRGDPLHLGEGHPADRLGGGGVEHDRVGHRVVPVQGAADRGDPLPVIAGRHHQRVLDRYRPHELLERVLDLLSLDVGLVLIEGHSFAGQEGILDLLIRLRPAQHDVEHFLRLGPELLRIGIVLVRHRLRHGLEIRRGLPDPEADLVLPLSRHGLVEPHRVQDRRDHGQQHILAGQLIVQLGRRQRHEERIPVAGREVGPHRAAKVLTQRVEHRRVDIQQLPGTALGHLDLGRRALSEIRWLSGNGFRHERGEE